MSKKVALVTGASAGMGKDTVKVLLQNGYTVYAAARRIDKMEELKPFGAKVLAMDVADDNSMVKGVEQIIAAEGRIDVLINNAGFGSYGAIEDVPMSDARYQLEVNLFGLARLTQLVLPHMRKHKFGKIVNVSSVGGKLASPLGGWYYASKFAVEGYSDTLRLEVKQFGIDVIVIQPGGVKTEWQGIAGESMKRISGNTAYKGLVQSAEKVLGNMEKDFPEPIIIADLILKAVTDKKPKARYVAGAMAKPILFLRKYLSDAMMDRIIMSQMK